jgi:hypothetical protein
MLFSPDIEPQVCEYMFIRDFLLSFSEQKNYALPPDPSSQKLCADTKDGLAGVQLNADLEAAMLDLIQKDGLLSLRRGQISQRLTSRKLTVVNVDYCSNCYRSRKLCAQC